MRVLRFSFHLCILLLTILFFRIGDAASPQPRELNTDRDAFTPSTFTIRPGFALNEMSHVYIQNRDGNPTNNYPEYICRIGANDIFEWRLGVNYSVGSQGNVVTSVEAGELPDGGGALYESNFLYGFQIGYIRSEWPHSTKLFHHGSNHPDVRRRIRDRASRHDSLWLAVAKKMAN